MPKRSTHVSPSAPGPRPTVLAAAVHLALAGILLTGWQPVVHAQTAAADARSYDIPAGPLGTVLKRFAAESGVLLATTPELVQGRQSPGVRGNYSAQAALAALLAGTGLAAEGNAQGGYRLRVAEAGAAKPDASAAGVATGEMAALPPVTVTGQAERAYDLPPAYAGGQVARGGRLGMLGNTDVMETPFSTTHYTSRLIENQQASTLGDVLRNDPSVGLAQSPAVANPGPFLIRGLFSNTNSSTFDGQPGMMPWWGAFPTEFIERVEVLKGPNALLNGMAPSGAVGGTVNLVPKRAGDTPLTRLTLGVESDALWKGHADIGRRFGANGEWGVRFNGSYKKGEGFIDDQKREGDAGALALDYRGQRLRLTLDAYRIQQKMHGGGALVASAGRGLTSLPAAPDGRTNMLPDAPESKSTTQALILGGEYDLSDQWTIYAKGGISRDDIPSQWTQNVSVLNARGDASLTTVAWPTKRDTQGAQAGLRGRFRTGPVTHALALSASYLTQDAYSYRLFGTPQSTNIYAPMPIVAWQVTPTPIPKTGELTLSGFALADTLGFMNDRALLTLGVRRQNVNQTALNNSGVVTSAYDESAWTPMAGLVIKPADDLSLYANYVEGLSAGTIVGATYANANQVFAPYKTKQMEVGAKLQTGRFTNTVSVFQITRPSVISDNSTTPPTARLDGEQRNRGVEWAIFGELMRGLRLLGGVTYLQGKQTRTQSGLYDGNQAPGSPPWVANLGADWDVPGMPGLALSGRVVHTGSQYVDDANLVKIPSWTVLDVGARYATRLGGKDVVFRANVDNLFDKKYWQGVSSSLAGYAMLGAPRTFRLSATMDF